MQAIRFPRGLPADEGNDMKLISGYTGAGRYKCLADVPEEKTELSLLHCGWESCVREDRHRQDLKEAYWVLLKRKRDSGDGQECVPSGAE